MTDKELWKQAKLSGEYDSWSFGDDPDGLAQLVAKGIKTATSSIYVFYELEGEDLPKVGEYSVVLDSKDNAICIIRTTKVTVKPFKDVPESFAFKEGEGDRSLTYWRKVHQEFFTKELTSINLSFDENMKVVMEEFELVYPKK